MDYRIRRATLDDRAALERLIAESARGLSREDYSEEQVEAALRTVFGVDTDLVLDGTYYVAEAERVDSDHVIKKLIEAVPEPKSGL